MTYLEHTCTSFDKQKKIGEKHPAFKDESGDVPQILVSIMIL